MKKRFMLLATFLVAMATSSKPGDPDEKIFRKIDKICQTNKMTPKPEIPISIFLKIKRGKDLHVNDVYALCDSGIEKPDRMRDVIDNLLLDPKKEKELLTRLAIDVAVRWPEKYDDKFIRQFKENHPDLSDPAIRMVLLHYFEKHPKKLAEVLENP